MNYKIIVYAITILVSTFVVSGLNINNIFKKNHHIESKLFIISLILIMSYLLSNLIFDIIDIIGVI
ncbi:MAG: DUF1146 domain-containing protein [Bacilli bacterium]|nr:DUF1146 domain-containing protein [Bacilli bacterium]